MAHLFEAPRTIAIEGPIGVGKSGLAHLIAEPTGAHCLLDRPENPFLSAFYRGDLGAAFPAQMWFLTSRYEQLRASFAATVETRIADFLFEKDKLFASLHLSEDELALYDRQYQLFRSQLPAPDLVIYLRATPATLRRRLRRAGLAGKAVSNQYLEQVIAAYEHFFFRYTATDLLVVDTDRVDFLQQNRDLQTLLRRLARPVHGTQYYLPLAAPAPSRLTTIAHTLRDHARSLAAALSPSPIPVPSPVHAFPAQPVSTPERLLA